jgi:hypothetical protein
MCKEAINIFFAAILLPDRIFSAKGRSASDHLLKHPAGGDRSIE